MKLTLSWLKQHLQTEASLETIAEKLTSLGLVVDSIENPGALLNPFKICQIVETSPHPQADRLQVCQVDTGSEVIQVVCGGANARTGLKTVLARVGDKIPASGLVIKAAQVRGVESCGMMCSAEELGLVGENSGIIEVNPKAPLGVSYADFMGLNDPILDIEITPNRGDCLGAYGIARELAAAEVGTLIPFDPPKVKSEAAPSVQVTLTTPESCPYFGGRFIKGVKNGPSPEWLQQRLLSIGLKPISALVDVTNFLTHDFGRPMHVFDARKLKGDLTVRKAVNGETLTALNSKDYVLQDFMTVVADESGPVAIGGIIGGEPTGCDEATVDVFLEAAYFESDPIAETGRLLGLITDARYHFERGVDPSTVIPGIEKATALILEICGGVAGEVVTFGQIPIRHKIIEFDPILMEKRGGLHLPVERMIKILKQLGYRVSSKNGLLEVISPSWRFDVEIPEDLIEDILRVEGYDKIPVTPFSADQQGPVLSASQKKRFQIIDALTERGLTEVITWSFMSLAKTKHFGGATSDLKLVNPISQDLNVMRPNALPNLLDVVRRNQNRAMKSMGIFEMGPNYINASESGQVLTLTGLRTGVFREANWAQKATLVDVFYGKADALKVLSTWGIKVENIQLTTPGPDWYHPGRSATLKQGQNIIGYFGEIHPRLLKDFDVQGPVVGFEILLSHLPNPKEKAKHAKFDLASYQIVERDFSFILDRDITADVLMKAVKKASPQLIESISIFDVFEGPELGQNKKSIALRIKLQPRDHTLHEDEIVALCQSVITLVEKQTGGQLRA